MKAFVLLTIGLFAAGLVPLSAQRLMSFRPSNPVVCFQGSQYRPDHIPPSEKFQQRRTLVTGRAKTATFQVEFVNFPSDGQAKNAVQHAIDIWESELISAVPIRVVAEWRPLSSGVLGQAIWGRAFANFGGEQHINTFYPVALAEKIAGRELNDPAEADIVASFNSGAAWYFGTDGNTPAGKMDLVTIVLHEIAHGLGFSDTYDVERTEGTVGLPSGTLSVPFIFDVFVENQGAQNLVHDFVSPSVALKDALQSTNVFFNSPLSVASLSGTRPELFAPATFDAGSSISHLDESTFSATGDPNRLMTPHIDFGESIHDPGGVLMGMLGDMGWINTTLVHAALKDTERMDGQPYPVKVLIRSDNGYDATQVKLHYTSDGLNYTVVNMTPTGIPNEYASSLPGTTLMKAYAYFLSVIDGADRTFTNPGQLEAPGEAPEQGTHFFTIGPDTQAPEIAHDPVTFVMAGDAAIEVKAEVTDNLGVGEVVVEYRVNGGALQTATMSKGVEDEYTASISLPVLDVGDILEYRVVAHDLASAENTTFHPEAGFHRVVVNGIQPAQKSYVNNFNSASSDFFGASFTITKPSGFADGAIHTSHPYDNGTGINEESNYTYTLQIPILLNETNPVMRFDEIVLVEPGDNGSVFGDPDFFDYVVVEGSGDGGNSWHPFAPGYDSRDNSVWLDRYNEEIVDDNSQAEGDPTLFRPRTIDMLASSPFAAGDEVIIRFRLFADALAHGWGWAIDNLSIQGDVTAVEEPLSERLKIYPVPVTSELLLELGTTYGHDLEFEICDLRGRVLLRENVDGWSGTIVTQHIDVSTFDDGMYLLRARSGNSVSVTKFCKVGK